MRAWILTALLALEVEGTSVAFPEAYSRLKAWLPLPLGHLWMVWIMCVALLAGRALWQALADARLRGWRLPLAHLAALATLWTALHQAPQMYALWLPLGGVVVATWGLCWLPPELWRSQWRPLLAATILAWAITVFSLALQNAWASVATPTFWASYAVLRLFETDVRCVPDRFLLGANHFNVAVLPVCSGFEGIGMMLAFSCTYLWVFRRELQFPRAWLMLPLGAVTMWSVNAVRIAVLVLIGARWSPAVAEQGFHSHAGWMAFVTVAAVSMVLARRWLFKDRPSAQFYPSAPYLVPFLTQMVLSIAGGLLLTGFDSLYPIRIAVVGLLLYRYRHAYRDLSVRSWATAATVGVLVFAAWLGLYRGPWGGVSPFDRLPPLAAAYWVSFRCLGAVAIVPFMEEQLFRNYLLRRIVSAHFEEVPVGTFTAWSCALSTVVFAALHQQWLAGLVAGLSYAALVYRNKTLGDAILAHSVTNLGLALYVLTTASWGLWQ